jgi:hypothetical protein
MKLISFLLSLLIFWGICSAVGLPLILPVIGAVIVAAIV